MSILTTEPAFYDEAMTADGELAMIPLEDSPWLALYRQASWLIPQSQPVIDLGCGTGRFAEQLRRRGHETYLGFDFSTAALDECRRYVGPDFGSFVEADLRNWMPGAIPATTIFTCLETLEHLEDDVSLIHRIPVGHVIIFSVPNFHDIAHLRRFQNVSDAWKRYGHMLEFLSWQRIGGNQHHIHLYRAIRRVSW